MAIFKGKSKKQDCFDKKRLAMTISQFSHNLGVWERVELRMREKSLETRLRQYSFGPSIIAAVPARSMGMESRFCHKTKKATFTRRLDRLLYPPPNQLD